MTGTTHLKEPTACTDIERQEFARLVLHGFPAAQNLEARVRAAKALAFHYAAGGALAGVAALKAPTERHREDIFRRAGAPVGASEHELDLGWVFVDPTHRGNGIATRLCQSLMARVPTSGVFATTRPDNAAMIRILRTLGFVRAGAPFQQRNEQLVLFLRSSPPS